MRIEDLIRNRRSVFPAQFSGEKIDDARIKALLELARWAPNHLHTEPWRFRVFKGAGNQSLMGELALLYRSKTPADRYSEAKHEKYLNRAAKLSHTIAISVQYDPMNRLPGVEESNAVACAVQNMWLGITATPDIRGYWSTGDLIYTPEFGDFLGLSVGEACLGLFYLGIIRENAIEPKGVRAELADKVQWIEG